MIRATLQQLRLFQAVAKHASFTRAAEEVHLSQPAVSIQVKRLEDQIGLPLFEHIGKQLYLTDAGRELFEACGDLFDRLNVLEGSLDDLRGEVAGSLRLAVVTTAKYFMPHYLGAFLRRYPKVHPSLKVTNRARVLERMSKNEDDIYVLGHLTDDKDLIVHRFLDDELVPFAAAEHPLAREKNISLQRLAQERLLFREPGSGIRSVLEQHFAEHDVEIKPYMELGSGEAIKQGVMAGIGIAMLSTYSLRLELDTHQLVKLDVESFPIKRKWCAVYPKGKRLTQAAEKFIEFLLNETPDII